MSLTLYFAGGGTKEVSDYMNNMRCDRLYSQLLDRKAISNQIEAIKNNNSGKLFIDSGAYTAHTKGTKIDVDEYINYLNDIHEYCTVYAQVDHIAGRFGQPKDPKEVEAAPGISWENYNYMHLLKFLQFLQFLSFSLSLSFSNAVCSISFKKVLYEIMSMWHKFTRV